MRYKIELDSEAQGYQPFILTGLVMVVGVILLFQKITRIPTSDFVNNMYWSVLLAVIVFDCASLKFVFPKEYVVLVFEDNRLEMRYVQKKSIKLSHSISRIEYYQEHTNLIVELKDKTGQSVYLSEPKPGWADAPKWPYKIKSPDKNATQFRCFELEKAVKALKTAGLVK